MHLLSSKTNYKGKGLSMSIQSECKNRIDSRLVWSAVVLLSMTFWGAVIFGLIISF